MSEDRRFAVLRAIVQDYVNTQEPVGSRALADRHGLGVSPATIRNDMALLEDAGYITQPHTSAGRVPTEKGYRLFVDRLAQVRPLSGAERGAIERFLAGAVDLDDVLARAARLLAQLTRQVAVVAYPALSLQVIRHVELVPTEPTRLLVILITSGGQVEQRTFVTEVMPADEDLATLRARLGEHVSGRRLSDLDQALPALTGGLDATTAELAVAIMDFIGDVVTFHDDRIVKSGTSHLARGGFESIHPVLEALEENVVLLRLFSELRDDGLAVSIGHENRHASLVETAIISSPYGDNGARVATLGPTSIDYAGTMATVRAVARYMTRILAG